MRRSRPNARVLGSHDSTRPSSALIDVRRKPRPESCPDWIRVDSVHQGDLANVKEGYRVNPVEKVTHYQFTGCVERICEKFLLPIPERLLASSSLPCKASILTTAPST